MSLSNVRPYFRTILDNLNYSEWKDGFNFENIPQSILDRSYHLGPPSITGIKNNQLDQELNASITIKIHIKGYLDPALAIDTAVQEGEEVIKESVLSTNRIGIPIKNVIFESMEIEPLNQNDDNSVTISMDFTCFVIVEKEDDFL